MALGTPQVRLADEQASAGASSFTTTATYTPLAKRLYIAHVHFGEASGDLDPTFSAFGQPSWPRVLSLDAFGRRAAIFAHFTGASPSSGAAVVARGSGSATWASCGVRIVDYPGALAVLQAPYEVFDFVQANSVAVSMTTGAGLIAFGDKWAVDETATPRTDWGEVYDDSVGSGAAWSMHCQYRNAADSAASMAWASDVGVSTIAALEVSLIPAVAKGTRSRHYADDDTEGEATPLAGENAPAVIPAGGTVRQRVQLLADGEVGGIQPHVRYRRKGSATGVWHPVRPEVV